MSGRASEVRRAIRQAFAEAEKARDLHLLPPAVPEGSGLGKLLAALTSVQGWEARAANVEATLKAGLGAAEALLADYEREVAALRAVQKNLLDGEPLPAGLEPDVVLACRLLSGTDAGLATARGVDEDLAETERGIADVRRELARARSAGEVAVLRWSLNFAETIGDGSADPIRRAMAAAAKRHADGRAAA